MRWKPILQILLFAAAAIATPLSAAEPPSMLLAEVDTGQADVTRYLVSEKLDGVRAYWDGRTLRTRSGNTINAPDWFVANFPQRALDGELWIGRQSFERLSAAVRRQLPSEAEWREIRYMVFELPQAPGTFRERAAVLRSLIAEAGVPWLKAVEQFEVSNRQTLAKKLAAVVKAGGEGLMLHRADAPYVTGRSDVLLKVKPWDDAEATVIGYRPGKGKYRGKLGALIVRRADGVEFALGSGLSDANRAEPPALGALVTYRYRGLTGRGFPRFASYHRVRE